jgi:hypothetical protein
MNYEVKDKICITPCPFDIRITKEGPEHRDMQHIDMLGKVPKVGSIACRFCCKYYIESNRIMGNIEKNTLICKLENALNLSSLKD